MNQISLYLKKYEAIGFKDTDLKNRIIEVIKKETGIEIDKTKISINDMSVNISVSGAAKAELFLKRKSIENQINEIKNVR